MSPPGTRLRLPGPATALLGRLCAGLARRPEFRSETLLADAAAQCAEPLRLAVIGQTSTGKSTLVNALLGARLAETGRAETLSGVSWYRHHGLPNAPQLGPFHRSVHRSAALTERFVLVDAPGTNSASEWAEAAETLFDGTSDAGGSCAAMLCLMRDGTVWADGLEHIRTFLRLTGGDPRDAWSAAVVAGKADTVAGSAERISDQLAAETGLPRSRIAAVSQQTAQAARCGLLTGRDLLMVQALAADPELRGLVIEGNHSSAVDDAWTATGRDPTDLKRLGEILSFPTLSALLDRAGDELARLQYPSELTPLMDELSGMAALESVLERLLADADLFTVRTVSLRLRRFAARWPSAFGLIQEGLAQLEATAEFRTLGRRAAALLLEGVSVPALDPGMRAASARLLRGQPPGRPVGEIRDFWQPLRSRAGVPVRIRNTASLIVNTTYGEDR